MLRTLCGHGHIVKVVVVWFIPSLEVPLGNMCQPIPICRVCPCCYSSTFRTEDGAYLVSPRNWAPWVGFHLMGLSGSR